MRLIFAGTPDFAASALKHLIAADHDIALVLTQPDRPAGRGMKLSPGAVKVIALAHGLPIFQPVSLKDSAVQQQLHAVAAEVMVVAAYGLILPQAVLDIPQQGCLNIHASLLPRWRGAAPIQRAILAGDNETGITIMQMDAGLDTGEMLARHILPIDPCDTAQTLHDKLAALGGAAIVDALNALQQDRLVPEAQDNAQATYAAKLTKAEGVVDWTKPAFEIARAVRAYNPFPGAHTQWQGENLKLWLAQAMDAEGEPGTVLATDKAGIVVACGQGALRITELQRAGGKRLAAAQFLAGGEIKPGDRFLSKNQT
ncbi:MAG: methionyl-tRNA formyltransferase [Burkholderiales bacterium]|nr:methionyl-tRNA formyltransferase [Burkholderiales bacterium]